jgi:hypothetical protein
MDQKSDPTDQRWQFGLRGMFVLTTVCAVLASLVAATRGSTAAKMVLVLYLMAMAAYIILRLPYKSRGFLRRTPAWDRLRRQRAELEAMTAEMKRKNDRAKASTDGKQENHD